MRKVPSFYLALQPQRQADWTASSLLGTAVPEAVPARAVVLINAQGGTVGSKGGPGMAAIFGPGGPIILPWAVRGDHFRGGTVHGVTDLLRLGLPQLKEQEREQQPNDMNQRRECKLTEVRIRPLPLLVVFVMNSELCDFRVTKQPCQTASRSRFWHRLFQDVFLRATYPLRYVYLRWSRVYLAIKTVETAPVFV